MSLGNLVVTISLLVTSPGFPLSPNSVLGDCMILRIYPFPDCLVTELFKVVTS